MNINRHNYESFFLLYVDNELSAQERNAVELFVQENADLKEELHMLQQSIVQADTVVFKGKHHLLKPEIVSAALKEQLLLYVDKELNGKQQKELQLVLAVNKEAAAELQLLHQTKIAPDNHIIFADKQLLYRKEPARIIAFGWRRIAVAAVIIGFAIWGTALYFNSTVNVADNQPAANIDAKKANAAKDKPATANDAEKTPAPETVVASTTERVINEKSIQKTVKPSVDVQQKTPVAEKSNELATQQKINSNNLPKPYFEENNNEPSNKNNPANVLPQTQDISKNIVVNLDNEKKDHAEETNQANVYTAAFTDRSNENKETGFALSDDEPKKGKLTGLLRKAKRLLDRNTQMKTGDNNNLKVANVEIVLQ